jgi:hypothetical protein
LTRASAVECCPLCLWRNQAYTIAVNFADEANILEDDERHAFITGVVCGNAFLCVTFGGTFGVENAILAIEIAFAAGYGEILVGDAVEFGGLARHFQSPSEVECKTIYDGLTHLAPDFLINFQEFIKGVHTDVGTLAPDGFAKD